MTADELKPIVYEEWGNKLNTTLWPNGGPLTWYGPGTHENGTYLNKTVVDDVFGWGEKYLTSPPVFPKLPVAYNTLLNVTKFYGQQAVYLLGRNAGDDYGLCALKVFTTPYCSTEYSASRVGADLAATCDDNAELEHKDDMRYITSLRNATSGNDTISLDWPSIGSEWANSLSLGTGITDGQAANSRLLTELIPTSPTLPTDRPSIAEALAVLASCTLLMSWDSAPFVQFWNYTTNPLEPGHYQHFNASLRAQELASGGNGSQPAQAFYIVLFAVFIINIMCLAYFISQNGLVTDFSEPLNLFSLAVNSPPSDLMAGSCGAGPKGHQFKAAWYVNAAGEHLFMENKVDDTRERGVEEREMGVLRSEVSGGLKVPLSPMRRAYEKMSRRKSWL